MVDPNAGGYGYMGYHGSRRQVREGYVRGNPASRAAQLDPWSKMLDLSFSVRRVEALMHMRLAQVSG